MVRNLFFKIIIKINKCLIIKSFKIIPEGILIFVPSLFRKAYFSHSNLSGLVKYNLCKINFLDTKSGNQANTFLYC